MTPLSNTTERPCTCHPDDNPPVPCAKKYALSDCQATISNTTERVELTLPWPARELHPNARLHWAAKAKHTKKARSYAAWAAEAAGVGKLRPGHLNVSIQFMAPDNRRRDTDGMISSVKAYLDGIADATGVDDSNFNLTIKRADPIKGGLVRVQIEAVTP